jgi:hypothetical protein
MILLNNNFETIVQHILMCPLGGVCGSERKLQADNEQASDLAQDYSPGL